MTGGQIKDTREGLDLSQAQFASLLGVHPMTVWKWEHGQSTPSPHQYAMLDQFARAEKEQPDIGGQIARWLATAGVAYAVFKLLQAAFDD